VRGFVRVEYSDLEAIRNVAKNDPDVVAVLVEPVQGEGGVRVPDDDYLPGLRQLCDEQEWLLMLDEVQTGMGRTGKMFAFQHTGIVPDVMTLAKGLGNGLPIGACLARGKAAEVFQPGSHATTFGGNPLVCSGALAVIRTLETEEIPSRAASLATRMLERFRETLALEARLLINVTAGNVIRLLPPLILSETEADELVDRVCRLIEAFSSLDSEAA